MLTYFHLLHHEYIMSTFLNVERLLSYWHCLSSSITSRGFNFVEIKF